MIPIIRLRKKMKIKRTIRKEKEKKEEKTYKIGEKREREIEKDIKTL